MENRELFLAIAVGAAVLAAVLAAGYVLLTAPLTTGPSPTPVPSATLSPKPTPYASIPSGPIIGTPSGSPYPWVPTPIRPVVKSSELAGWGTDKDTYKRGETATTYIIIKNTGTVPVDEARLDIKVERYVSVLGYVNLQSTSTTLTGLGVQPGETKKAEYAIAIPADYQGIPTAGKYRFTVDVYVWDTKIGSFQEEVEVK